MNDFPLKMTESLNPRSENIDTLPTPEILDIFFSEDEKIVPALKKEKKAILQVIENVVTTFRNGGRLFYIGAGTSGRLGNLDAVECPPTFGTSPEMVQSVLAGGSKALQQAIEGAEDNREEGKIQAKSRLTAQDICIGIAASGSTPFVLGFLEAGYQIGAQTALITFNPIQEPYPYIQTYIAPEVGPEIIAGSTRLKAGTATKLVLNLISTITMIRLGKVYSHFMVDVTPTCEKLRKRAQRILSSLTGLDGEKTSFLLQEAQGQIKQAMLMHHKKISFELASRLLDQHQGNLRLALTASEH